MRETDRQIWARVRESGTLTAEQALLPERLTALMAQEKTLAAACRQLEARLFGTGCNAVRRIRAQSENRVRRLKTQMYLRSGLRADPQSSSTPFYALLCEALRAACLLAQTLQTQYLKTAEEFPGEAEMLSPLAAELGCNLKMLTALLQRSL